MLISIVVPSYNRADLVCETLDSILAQRVNAEIEIIIGDDCSTDNAREILLGYKSQYPKIIHLIFHDHNIGLGANWATCIKACNGDYICNCDNDDYWHNPDKLQIQLDYMESHPKANVLITNHRTHNRKTGEIKEEQAYIDRTIPLQQAFFHGKERFCNATLMYRADFLKEHLPLDDFIKYQFTLQDWTAWIILSAYTDFDLIEPSTATFGIETVSITRPDSLEKLQKRLDKELECYKYCCSLFPDKLFFDEDGWYSYVNLLLLSMSYKMNDYEHAHQYAQKVSGHSKKVLCAHNRILFKLYCLLKSIFSNLIKDGNRNRVQSRR